MHSRSGTVVNVVTCEGWRGRQTEAAAGKNGANGEYEEWHIEPGDIWSILTVIMINIMIFSSILSHLR